MRLFEILLIASTFLVLWLTSLHPVPSLTWKRVAVLVMVLVAGAHLVFEGSKSNARTGAPALEDRPNFPVLIFLEDITGYRQMNTFQVEYLVSRGYVVAAIDQPFVAATVNFPDGRRISGWSKERMNPLIQQSITPVQPAPSLNGTAFDAGIIPYFAKDVGFLLDQIVALNRDDPNAILKSRLDLNHIGIFGVSLGGIVVAEACRTERRLRACLVMDAPMSASIMLDGLQQPSMWLTRDAQTMRNENWSTLTLINIKRPGGSLTLVDLVAVPDHAASTGHYRLAQQ
jgi:pimeloyl-ACP methyl ester carboxylesterase